MKFEKAKELFIKGYLYFNEMKYLAAVEFFRNAVAEYPEYYTAREYLARSYRLAGFTEEALKEWEVLSNAVSNNVSITNKINTLKFRETRDVVIRDSMEFVFSAEYNPVDLGRYRFPGPVDIAVDKSKNLYVTSFSGGKLVKLDINGEGESIFNLGIDSKFYGIDCAGVRICLSDFKSDKIYLLDTDLNVKKSFGSPGNEDGMFHGPEGVSFDKSGNVYIVDSGNYRVQKFDDEGNFIFKFGKMGEYEGQFANPSGVLAYNEQVYITDPGNSRIACFDDSGNFIKNIVIDGMEKPRGIDIYNEYLIVSDEKKGLLFYGLNNESKTWFNSWDNKRAFSKLISATADTDGTLYCLDNKRESVLVFTPIQNRYNNLDIEITSADISGYPAVTFYLNIRNRGGKPVYGLKEENFKVVEDGANVTGFSVDYFKERRNSASFVLCVDRSVDTSGYHNELTWISDFVLKKMRKNDSIKVLNFNKDVWTGNNFDWSRRRTISALQKKSYEQGKCTGKALYNAISDLLLKYDRRGVLLVTDGGISSDSFKQYTIKNIIEYAKGHFIPIYIVTFKDGSKELERIARETGGGLYRASEVDSLRKIYDLVKYSDEYRYMLAYSTYRIPSVKGWWAEVKLEVKQKGQTGVEWGGYFVP
ncbi:MAG: hypothetical protein MUC95_02285 [Spirochaetes bacterium]|nr:hypothetical protein [Spirochaetota bacterium]